MEPIPIIDGPAFDRQTILLVEDNEDDVFMMRRTFQKAGVPNPLQVVADGEQAMAYLKGLGAFSDRQAYPLPLLILLDLNMPKKSGLEVLAWLRQQPGLRRITVHVLTASTRTADVLQALELGANAYIVKPSRIETLANLLNLWHAFGRYQAFPAATGG